MVLELLRMDPHSQNGEFGADVWDWWNMASCALSLCVPRS